MTSEVTDIRTLPIAQLCSEGFAAETSGDVERAHKIYLDAWERSETDLDKCMAAHFVARVHDDESEKLRWNLESLRRAEATGGDSLAGFYPSMHTNLGFSYLATGDRERAREQFELAQGKLDALEDGPYGDEVRRVVRLAFDSLSTHDHDAP